MEFKKSVIKGVTWTSLTNLLGFLVNFSLGVWLARILGPGAYGLIGMILVITGFARLLLDFGFSEALIQNQQVTDTGYSSVFWMNMGLSVVFTTLVFVAAPWIAKFYHNDNLIPLCQILSLTFIANGLSLVQRTRLEKELRFKEIGIAEITSSVVSVVFALILAQRGYGVWSLVALHLTKPFVYNIVVWVYSRWLPKFTFHVSSIRQLFHFSYTLFMNGLLGTAAMNLDKLLIGRSLGDVSLGVYTKSLSTVRMPVDQMMSAVSRVMFPAYANIQHDKSKIYSIYCRIVVLTSTLIFPIMMVFFFFSTELITSLFGEQWISMIPIFKTFSIAIGFLPFNIMVDGVIKSQGRTDLLNAITYIEKPMVIMAVLIGLAFGSLQSVATAITVNIFLVFLLKSYLLSKGLGKNVSNLYLTHLKALRIVILPILGLVVLAQTPLADSFTWKALIAISGGLISLGILRNSTWKPLMEFTHSIRISIVDR